MYLNTAAVGLASLRLSAALRRYVDEWTSSGLDFVRGEAAAEASRSIVARLIGADRADVALIPSVSAAAGLVAAQLASERPTGQNVVIGEREYSSNHFPWRMLAERGYQVRQVPFRNGGLEPDDIEAVVDGATRLVAVSGVQTATGHRTDVPAVGQIAHAVGAMLFVDGSQLVGAASVAEDLRWIDVLAASDHKFLLNAGRGVGYCYLSRRAQARLTPVNAGWKAGAEPFASFFGPRMELSTTASRFDNSISWLAAIGDEAALSAFDTFGAENIYRRNAQLADRLRSSLTDAGWAPADVPKRNWSTIVSVPLGDRDAGKLLAHLREQRVVAAARDGNLRLSVHFYNHDDDIAQVVAALRKH